MKETRNTFQKTAVFEMLQEMHDHPSADRVYERVRERYPNISRSTVYRILNQLAERGAVYKVMMPGAADRFDFNNVPDNKANKMQYTIDGEKITVTANVNDGYGFLPYYVELEAGKTYVFDCVTNGMWYSSSNSDDVEAWLMLDGNNTNNSDVTVHLKKNEYYYFKAPATGKYWLRLDVNTAGKTYYFDNIRVLGKVK